VQVIVIKMPDLAYADLLRESLTRADRRFCQNVIAAIASAIAEIGGMHAVEACVTAVIDVHRWWP
jgi:hypothetical protein